MSKLIEQLKQLKINKKESSSNSIERALQLGEKPYLSQSALSLMKQKQKDF